MLFSKRLWLSGFVGLALTTGGVSAADETMASQVDRINSEWARIKYRVPDKEIQYRQLEALAKQAGEVVAHYPGRAEPILWQGIVTSEEAAKASIFQQLSLATSARNILQRAAAIDPRAASGGVLMSIGVLYYKVPGFPLAWGSATKARDYLVRALAIDPAGLDANFFLADFLTNQSDYAGAKAHLVLALKAPVDVHRPVWDAGRRAEATALLAKVEKHLG